MECLGVAHPFLFWFLLVLIAIYIRVNFQESPIFEELKAKQGMTKIHGRRLS